VRSHDNQRAYVRYRHDGGDNESMERTALTPGKLYARLSAEFRTLRPARCESCAMPMPYLVRRADDAPNWAVGDEVAACAGCTLIVAEVVGRASRQYDLWDPISIAVAAHPMALRSTRLDHPRKPYQDP
jgi:hypothetical protein